MAKITISLYPSQELLDAIDAEANKRSRSRNDFLLMILRDVVGKMRGEKIK